MRSMSRSVLLMSLAVVLALFTASSLAEGPWSFEARATYIVPIEGDGGITSTRSTTGELDMLASLVPELAVSYQATERFSVELAALWANMDMEIGFQDAGDVDFGDTDLQMYSLSGIFDAYEWGDTRLRVGLSVAMADFDDIDITESAEAGALTNGWAIRTSSLDSATLFGIVIRVDTPVGANGWYFSSNLRYLIGAGDFEITGDDMRLMGSKASADAIYTGDFDFDPLVLSLGFGYRY